MHHKNTSLFTVLAAAAALTALGGQAAKAADSLLPAGTSFYGTLGYADHRIDGVDLGTVQGRLGARFGRYLGVEGELGAGVNHAGLGGDASVGINDQEAVYGVAYLPVAAGVDLFGRVGVGHTGWDYKGAGHPDDNDHSVNYGGGAQWFWSGKDGVRAEYTKESFDRAPDSDTWGASYVRRF